jgi:predicted AlkP superfamily phosphohydrolase/phosphomutase
MRFLRMLTNSLLAGGFGAAYLTVLVMQLNPEVPLLSDTAWRWFTTIGLLYGVHLAVAVYVVVVVREFFVLDVLSPGWASVRILAWLGAAAAATAATLMWLNASGFAATLSGLAARRMMTGAAATTVSALVLLGVAVAHYSFGRRGSKVGAALFVLAAFGSLALPLAARGPGRPSPLQPLPAVAPPPDTMTDVAGPRVVMLLLDGASLDYIWPRAAEGRLPHFARLLDQGASMYLATIRPTQPDPVWAAVATGMYPARNGVRSAAAYFARGDDRAIDLLPDHCLSHALVQLGFVRERPNTSEVWRARPLWSILTGAGISSGVVGWPLTHPVLPVDGFLVSDRLHQLVGSIAEFNRAAYPEEVLPLVGRAATGSSDPRGPARAGPDAPEDAALGRDRLYARVMRALEARGPSRFMALRYAGLDTVGHYYFQFAQPHAVRGVSEEERRRFAQAFDRYYTYIDGEIGAAIEALAPGDLLVVVSGFGMQPLNPLKRTLGRLLGDPDLTGTHERAPDGFLLAYGTSAGRGRRPRGSVVDVTPTLLYFLGLPVGRDMDGFARTDLFTRDFTGDRPIAFIPSYR